MKMKRPTLNIIVFCLLMLFMGLSDIALSKENGSQNEGQKQQKADLSEPCQIGAICKPAIIINCDGIARETSDKPNNDEAKSCPDADDKNVLSAYASILHEIIWAIVFIIALLYLGKGTLRSFFAKIKKITGGGVEVDLSIDRVREVRASFSDSYKDYRKTVKDEYERQIHVHGLDKLLEEAVNVIQQKITTTASYRTTVHVPDVVFEGYLYQLLEYYPDGGGSGRRISNRFGIVGRAWRTEKSIGQKDTFDSITDRNDKLEKLKEEWGMTKKEAIQLAGLRPSFLCIILRDAGAVPVGILYSDSETVGAFGASNADSQRLADELEADAAILRLSSGINNAMKLLRKRGTFLEID